MSRINLVGKDAVFGEIRSAFLKGSLSHAILLEGDRGMGKKTLAKEVCALIVCEEKNTPCGSCVACSKIDKAIHPDVFEIFPSGKTQMKLEDIKPIKTNILIRPNDAEYKIFVIHEADKMSINVQNALLKMIEEPPQDTFFIFLCENSHSLLATVLSRVTVYRLSPVTPEQALKFLEENYSHLPQEKISRAAELCRGNLGLAVELASGDKMRFYDGAVAVLNAALGRDKAALCLEIGKFSKNKEDALEFCLFLKLIFRDVCAIKAGSRECMSGLYDEIVDSARRVSSRAAIEILESCDDFYAAVMSNVSLPLCLTALEIKINKAIKK